MKIVEIIPDLKFIGGAERFFASLCGELESCHGVELYILTLYDGISNDLFFKEPSKIRSCNKKKGIDLKASLKLRKKINEIKPDIVHTHLSCINSYFLAFGFKKTKWKLIHTLHNVPEKESNAFSKYLIRQYCKKNLITLIGISDLITGMAVSKYGNKCKTIYNGIDLVNSEWSLKEKKEYDFVCVARFSEQKNHKMLIDAIKQLSITHPNLKVAFVGGGELLETCKKYSIDNSVNKFCSFLGYSNNVASILAKSKIFILSSLYEGNPLSILEAMNFYLPIIAPRVGGIPDVVKENINGFLFEKNNLNEMVSIMEYLLKHNDVIVQIGKQNHNDVNKFSMKKCSQQYFLLFKSVLFDFS